MKPLHDIRMPDPQRLRVLLVAAETDAGATTRHIVHLARGLDRRRFEPAVLCLRTPPAFTQEIEAAGVPAIRVGKRARLDPDFLLRLVRVLRLGGHDVMHGFDLYGELWCVLARRFVPAARRPVMLSSVRGGCEGYTPWQWRLKRWVAAQSQGLIADSAIGAEQACARLGLPDDAIDLVYDGIAAEPPGSLARLRVRQELGLGPTTPLALFVGPLLDHKNLPTLLRAMQRLQGAPLDLRLVIAGEGPMRATLERDIAALGLRQRVSLLGERDDVAELMAAASFLVLPSLREGLPDAILQAMAAGLPVIASRRGGSPELVEHERTGLLFDAPDAGALAQAMATLGCDAGLRLRLAAAARARMQQRHSISSMVRTMERHYLAAQGRRPLPSVSLARTTG